MRRDRIGRRRQMVVFFTVGLAALAGTATAAQQDRAGLRPLIAALHVHSTTSTGTLDLDQLAERAERLGIDAVILSDNFALRFEYGLPPLRASLRKTMTIPSLTARRVGGFLRDVAAAQARHPQVMLIPGVEVVPHYYWTGSLLDRNLTMHNSQRNLLVLGLREDKDYAALPLSGNPASYRYGWEGLWSVAPGLLFVPAGWLWHRSIRSFTKRRKAGGGTISQLEETYVYWRIATGGPGLPQGATPWNSSMPVWQDFFSDEEIWQVVAYIYEASGSTPRVSEEH